MSFQVEFDPSLASETPGGDAVELRVWKDEQEELGETDLICTVRISDQQDGVHIRVLDARGRPVAHLLDGLLKSPHRIEDRTARTAEVGKIAHFLDERGVVINRGAREGVKPGALYCIRSNKWVGEPVVILYVYEVRDMCALARSLWIHQQCPGLKRGWPVFLLGIPEAEV